MNLPEVMPLTPYFAPNTETESDTAIELFPSRPLSHSDGYVESDVIPAKPSNSPSSLPTNIPTSRVVDFEVEVEADDFGHSNAEAYREREIIERKIYIEKPAAPQRRGLHFVELQGAELELCQGTDMCTYIHKYKCSFIALYIRIYIGIYLYFVEDIDLRLKYAAIPAGIVLCKKTEEHIQPSGDLKVPPRHVMNKVLIDTQIYACIYVYLCVRILHLIASVSC